MIFNSTVNLKKKRKKIPVEINEINDEKGKAKIERKETWMKMYADVKYKMNYEKTKSTKIE